MRVVARLRGPVAARAAAPRSLSFARTSSPAGCGLRASFLRWSSSAVPPGTSSAPNSSSSSSPSSSSSTTSTPSSSSSTARPSPQYSFPLYGLEEAPAPSTLQVDAMRRVLGTGGRFVGTEATELDPHSSPPLRVEVPLLGRSNVGKSTLVNALLGTKKLASTSRQPGRTTHLDFFVATPGGRDAPLAFVDMPGYGFARRSQAEQERWGRVALQYLRTRDRHILRRVLWVLDSRHGLEPVDEAMFETLETHQIPYHVVLSKIDALEHRDRLMEVVLRLQHLLRNANWAFPAVNAVSARSGAGLPELRAALALVTRMDELPTRSRNTAMRTRLTKLTQSRRTVQELFRNAEQAPWESGADPGLHRPKER